MELKKLLYSFLEIFLFSRALFNTITDINAHLAK